MMLKLQRLMQLLAVFAMTLGAHTAQAQGFIPNNLSATGISYSEIEVGWTNTVSDATYYVEMTPQYTENWQTISDALSAPTFTATGLEPSQTYYFRLRVEYGSATEYTEMFMGSTLFAVGFAPENYIAQGISESEIQVTWTKKADAALHYVEMAPQYTEDWQPVGGPTTDESITVGNLESNLTYNFRIRVEYGGNTEYTDIFSGATLGASGFSPEVYSAQYDSPTSIQVNWTNKVEGAHYVVEVAPQYTEDWTPVSDHLDGGPFTVTGLQPYQTYNFRIRTMYRAATEYTDIFFGSTM